MCDFRAFILKEMHFPRGLLCLASQPLSMKSQGEDGALPGKAGAARGTPPPPGLRALPASLPPGLPGHPLCHFQRPGRGPGPCLLRNIEIFKKEGFMCIAPNHVLLLIS